MSLADKFTTGTNYFVSLTVKILLLSLSLLLISFSLPATDKIQYFLHLSFNPTMQFINGISSDLQELMKYFTGRAIVSFFRISLAAFGAGWATVLPNNLALYLEDLKLLFQNNLNYILSHCTLAWVNLHFQHHLLLLHRFVWYI